MVVGVVVGVKGSWPGTHTVQSVTQTKQKWTHTRNPLTILNAFVNVQLRLPSDRQSVQLGDNIS